MDISQLTGQNNLSNFKTAQSSSSGEVSASQSSAAKVELQNKMAAESESSKGSEVERMQEQMQKNEIKELVEQMNRNLDPFNTSLRFGFHDKSETYYVSVIDTATNDIIRKFPSEEAMDLSIKMKELVGMIFDQKG